MNALQYLVLTMAVLVIGYSPTLIVKSVRRQQKYRTFEVPLAASMVAYFAVTIAWPSAVQAAPPVVHRLLPVLFALWFLDFLGLFRWLFNRGRIPHI